MRVWFIDPEDDPANELSIACCCALNCAVLPEAGPRELDAEGLEEDEDGTGAEGRSKSMLSTSKSSSWMWPSSLPESWTVIDGMMVLFYLSGLASSRSIPQLYCVTTSSVCSFLQAIRALVYLHLNTAYRMQIDSLLSKGATLST